MAYSVEKTLPTILIIIIIIIMAEMAVFSIDDNLNEFRILNI